MEPTDSSSEFTRRRVLTGLAAGSAALAGCGGSSSTPDGTTSTGSPPGQQTTTTAPGGSEVSSSTPAFKKATASLPKRTRDVGGGSYTPEYAGPGSDLETLWKLPEEEYENWDGTAAISNGMTYVAGFEKLRAIGPNGEISWSRPLNFDRLPQTLFVDGTVVLNVRKKFIGLNPDDGSREWVSEHRYGKVRAVTDDGTVIVVSTTSSEAEKIEWVEPETGEVVKTSGEYLIRAPVAITDSHIYTQHDAGLSTSGVTAINRSDGSTAWYSEDFSDPMLASGGMLIQAGNSSLHSSSVVAAFDVEAQKEAWRHSISLPNPEAAADGETVYVAFEDKIRGYDLESGDQTFERVEVSNIASDIAIGSTNLYYATEDGVIHVVDTESGEHVGKASVSGAPQSLTVVGNRLYGAYGAYGGDVTDEFGKIAAFGST